MNGQELFLSTGKCTGVFYCETCRLVYPSKEKADLCCGKDVCDTCGKEHGRKHWRICESCESAKRDRHEREKFESAEKVEQWDGWVYLDGVGHSEGYFESVSDLIDYLVTENEKFEYAWTCDSKEFVQADYSDLIQSINEDAYEDFNEDSLSGVDELKKAIRAFNEANKHHLSYSPNYKKAVLLKFEEGVRE